MNLNEVLPSDRQRRLYEEQVLLRGANDALHGRAPQPRRSYLTERIMSLDLHQLADRSAPLPKDIPLDALFAYFSGCYKTLTLYRELL